ncbi:hypothetical protein [Pelagibacterium montanilacus]|uniref:hypothetical protein n=1 Tax=Pelagibacterium montanilacus TaxID=2185280 RepID=UPI000F8E89E2|nr:hypothetical protein [Pelagibacterium montanilacus]
MGSTLVLIVTAIIIGLGVRAIMRDWRKSFREEDKRAAEAKNEQLQRNRSEVKKGAMVTLERDKDGVYRPKKD